MPYKINMLNKSDKVKGQGVASASLETINLIKRNFENNFEIFENEKIFADITHIHSINLSFFFKIKKLKKHGKVVGSVHFLPETLETSLKLPKFIKKIFYAYIIKMYKNMDYLVTVNPNFIEKLKYYGLNEKKISYIPNFVDDKNFFPLDYEKKQQLKEKYNIKKNKFTVLGVGQLLTRKGVLDFLKVAEKLKDFEFVWAGGFSFGVISDGYNELKKQVKNPPGNVHFLGIVERNKMNEIYNLADVLFLPSYNELFPMTILEAMNCNIPILVRDIEIYKNILFNFYLKESSVDGFAKILKKLNENKSFYKEATEKSLNGHKFYSSEHVLKMWQQFYKKILSSPVNNNVNE